MALFLFTACPAQRHQPPPINRNVLGLTTTPTAGRKSKRVLHAVGGRALPPGSRFFEYYFPPVTSPVNGKVILLQPSLAGRGKGRGAKGVSAAVLPAGCAHRPRLHAGGCARNFQPSEARAPRTPGRQLRFPRFPKGPEPAGDGLSAPAQSQLKGAPRRNWTEPGRPGPLAPGLRSPDYVPVPAFPLRLLTRLGSPGPEPAPPASPPPPSPARPRAPGLSARCGAVSRGPLAWATVSSCLRGFPQALGPLCGLGREGPGQRLSFHLTHPCPQSLKFPFIQPLEPKALKLW